MRWRVECAAVPRGRAEFLRRFCGLLLALRLAPFPAESGTGPVATD